MNHKIKCGLAWIALLCGCAESRWQCPGRGAMVSDSDAHYCMYQKATQAVVIEGGFECPAAMSFRLDLETHIVCSDHAVDRARVPEAVCAALDGACKAHRPTPNEPRRESEAPTIGDAGLPEPANMPAAGQSMPAAEQKVWEACVPAQPGGGVLETGKTGDICVEASDPFGCGISDQCSEVFATCDPSHLVKLGALTVLDCSLADGYAGLGDGVQWQGADACAEALDSGASGQACSGAFVCARATEDPCCAEYALCNQDPSLPTGLLMRYRQCDRGCLQVEPNDSVAPLTNCADVDRDPLQLETADRPCEGDLICWDDQDLASGAVTGLSPNGMLRWCGAGVVRGQHTLLGNVYIPSP